MLLHIVGGFIMRKTQNATEIVAKNENLGYNDTTTRQSYKDLLSNYVFFFVKTETL